MRAGMRTRGSGAADGVFVGRQGFTEAPVGVEQVTELELDLGRVGRRDGVDGHDEADGHKQREQRQRGASAGRHATSAG